MRTSRQLLIVSAVASVLFLVTRPLSVGDWPVIFKVLSILLLAVAGFRFNKLLAIALTLSSLGDFLLGFQRLGNWGEPTLFLFGLGSFLIAHVVYIVMFRRYSTLPWSNLGWARAAGILAILVAMGSVLAILRHSLGPLLIPVVLYALVLCGMAISAVLADLDSRWAAIGAVSFVASDAMLAIGKFRSPFAGSEQLIWISYYAAQFLICWGVMQHELQSQIRRTLKSSSPS